MMNKTHLKLLSLIVIIVLAVFCYVEFEAWSGVFEKAKSRETHIHFTSYLPFLVGLPLAIHFLWLYIKRDPGLHPDTVIDKKLAKSLATTIIILLSFCFLFGWMGRIPFNILEARNYKPCYNLTNDRPTNISRHQYVKAGHACE